MGEVLACELTSKQVARLAGIKYPTLHYWCATGALPEPMVPAEGRGKGRRWGFIDLIRARMVARLRRDHVSLQMIRRVVDELVGHYGVDDPLATVRLVVAGDRVFWPLDDKTLLEVLTGQLGAKPLILIDVSELARETVSVLAEVCA